ncbi:MAG: membrane dipeptidase [Clostridia bacterium]|nr:membrane dipeptidase [Clostridia bacterium]
MDFFDLHTDWPFEAFKRKENFKNGDLAVTLAGGSVFRYWRALCAIWIPDEHPTPRARYREVLAYLKGQTEIAKTAADLEEKTAFLLSLEGASLIENEADVDMLFQDGVRALSLTWNGKNKLAGGSNTAGEFTALGERVVMRMNERGIAVDVSHLNDCSFEGAVAAAKHVFASHSCCRDVCHVRRNLTLGQIRKICDKGGIIGLCLYPKFLGEGDCLENFYRHLDFLVSHGFEQNIAIGSDFDGAKMDKRLDAVDKMAVLYNYLKNKGLNEEFLHRLFYKNAQDYFYALLKLTE